MQEKQETPVAANVWFHRYAILCALATYAVLIAGASVTSTGSGLSVPDWPLSYGKLFPPMVGGVLFEHGHRMIAGTVALMLFALAFWAWKVERRAWVQYLTGLAVTLVVVQALLGGITVLMLLPASVSVAHAGLAMLLFGVVLIIAAVTSPGWPGVTESMAARKLGGLSLLVAALIFGQILIGAVMRHIGAGLACPDFPLCHGELIPPLDSLYMASHFYHRVGGYLVAVAVISLSFAARSWVPEARGIRRLAHLAAMVVVIQFVLGVASILTKLSPPVTVLHHAGGAALFGLITLVTVWAFRLGHRSEARAPEVGHQLAGSPAS